jgi:hypothetical protein
MGLFSSSVSSVRKVFTDTFNRVNQTPLGTASDGTEWDNIRPGFSISSNKASATNPSSYPLAAIDFPSSNVAISLSGTDQGSSAALWVTDSGNWWAVGIDQAPVTCNCQTGSTCNAWNQSNCAGGNNFGGNCSSWSFVGATCAQWNTRNIQCSAWGITTGNCRAWTLPPGNCIELLQGSCSSPPPPGNCRAFGSGSCRANSGGNCRLWNSGRFRNCRATNPVVCSAWNTRPCNAWNTRSCDSWNARPCGQWSTRTNVCSLWNTRNNFCTNNVLPPGNCSANNSPFNFCNSTAWNFFGFTCNSFNTSNCTNWSTFTFGCQTCYPQYIRLFQSVSSTVTEIFNWTVTSIVRSFRVKTNKDEITIEAFSDDNHVTKIGGDIIFTPTGVAVTPKFGIVLKPSEFNQGTAIDGIQITRN